MIGFRSTARFVLDHLPAPPSRVLEVGCGSGELALHLAAADYEVVAIDPEAPAGDIFRRVGIEEFLAPEPFDGVVANRSLHHIHDLHAAIDSIAELLPPNGVFVLNEHAWERLDRRTARWYLSHLTQRRPVGTPSLAACTAEWQRDHSELHDYAAMRAALDRRFTERAFDWCPYLYAELGEPSLEREERRLIDAGGIEPTGFRWVGQPI